MIAPCPVITTRRLNQLTFRRDQRFHRRDDGPRDIHRLQLRPGNHHPRPGPADSVTEFDERARRALELVFALNPRVKPFVLGGDHSVAWPVVKAMHDSGKRFCIVTG